jgi:hypothetical protein
MVSPLARAWLLLLSASFGQPLIRVLPAQKPPSADAGAGLTELGAGDAFW